MTPVGGGVTIHPQQALATKNLLPDEDGKISEVRESVSLKTCLPAAGGGISIALRIAQVAVGSGVRASQSGRRSHLRSARQRKHPAGRDGAM